MQEITFQFSTMKGLGDAVIRGMTHSEFSHVDLVTSTGRLLGARWLGPQGRGVQLREYNYQAFSKRTLVTLYVEDFQAQAFWQFAYAQLGKPYDPAAILGYALSREWRNPTKWYCSEFAGDCTEVAGIVQIATNISWLDPQTLFIALCACKYWLSTVTDKGMYQPPSPSPTPSHCN